MLVPGTVVAYELEASFCYSFFADTTQSWWQAGGWVETLDKCDIMLETPL